MSCSVSQLGCRPTDDDLCNEVESLTIMYAVPRAVKLLVEENSSTLQGSAQYS